MQGRAGRGTRTLADILVIDDHGDMRQFLRRARWRGADAWLAKPFTVAELLKVFGDVLAAPLPSQER